MRISDCSSDVCSSDLGHGELVFDVLDHRQAVLFLQHVPGRHGGAAHAAGDGAQQVAVGGHRAGWRQAELEEAEREVARPEFVHEGGGGRSEEHTSELQSLMRISYAVFCLKKKKTTNIINITE